MSGGASTYEDVHARTCDECGQTTQATVTRTLLASDYATEAWTCRICGHHHHIELVEGDDS